MPVVSGKEAGACGPLEGTDTGTSCVAENTADVVCGEAGKVGASGAARGEEAGDGCASPAWSNAAVAEGAGEAVGVGAGEAVGVGAGAPGGGFNGTELGSERGMGFVS